MSDRELNHELDDELLSAYVDGELTEAERAAVEARLVADPDAKHTLQQLRMVSQSVQALPQKSIGRDLREQILRRTEQLKPPARVAAATSSAAADGTPSRLGDTMPQITVFRTRRSWVWASLVVAAGLMIMFLQSGNERGTNLAKNDNGRLANGPVETPMRRSLGEAAPSGAIDPAQVANLESPGPATTPMASEPTGTTDALRPGMASGPLATSSAGPPASAQSPSPTSVASDRSAFQKLPAPASPSDSPSKDDSRDVAIDGVIARGKIAAASPAPGRVELGAISESKITLDSAGKVSAGEPQSSSAALAMKGRAADGGAFGRESGAREEQLDDQNQLVVVHVVAKPEAFKNKTFDRLLVSNGIAMESRSESDEKSDVTDDRLAKKVSEAQKAADKLADKQSTGEQDVDMVLVEAPQSAILSCMAGLRNDTENYAGIEVDQPPTDKDRADTNSESAKKAADNLSGFSRGIVPARQKDLLRNQQYYYHTNTYGGLSNTQRGFEGGLGGANDALKEKVKREPLGRKQASVADQGRARRFVYSDEQSRRGGEADVEREAARSGAEGSSAIAETSPSRQDRKVLAKEEAENMHVLFLVCPDSEAATTEKATK